MSKDRAASLATMIVSEAVARIYDTAEDPRQDTIDAWNAIAAAIEDYLREDDE